jgi:hypothetical protein
MNFTKERMLQCNYALSAAEARSLIIVIAASSISYLSYSNSTDTTKQRIKL